MTTTNISCTILYIDTTSITFRVLVQDPLDLSQLTVDRDSGLGGYLGMVNPGTIKHPGIRTIELSDANFDRIYSACVGHTTATLSISYDGSYNVTDIEVVAVGASISKPLVQPAKLKASEPMANGAVTE